METTIQKTVVIPSKDVELLQQLVKERGWRVQSSENIIKYFMQKKTMTPPLSEEEICEEMKSVRHALSRRQKNMRRLPKFKKNKQTGLK